MLIIYFIAERERKTDNEKERKRQTWSEREKKKKKRTDRERGKERLAMKERERERMGKVKKISENVYIPSEVFSSLKSVSVKHEQIRLI